jgi:hypothetical protein
MIKNENLKNFFIIKKMEFLKNFSELKNGIS